MKSSRKHSFKLSKRLQHIEKMVTSQYNHIWDCCCDHGLLGLTLLSRNVPASHITSKVHFVDIVPELMTALDNKLQRFYAKTPNSNTTSWQTHCLDVTKLPLAQYEGRHLIIIAGVGGDLMIKFITAIYQQHQDLNIDFLLCPVHHQFSLRQKLIELDFSLQDEVLIEDNQRFYEIMLVSCLSDENNKISPVGNKIWQLQSNTPLNIQPSQSSIDTSKQTEIAAKYLQKTLNHYQRIQQGFQQGRQQDFQQAKSNEVQNIIDAYRALTQV